MHFGKVKHKNANKVIKINFCIFFFLFLISKLLQMSTFPKITRYKGDIVVHLNYFLTDMTINKNICLVNFTKVYLQYIYIAMCSMFSVFVFLLMKFSTLVTKFTTF